MSIGPVGSVGSSGAAPPVQNQEVVQPPAESSNNNNNNNKSPSQCYSTNNSMNTEDFLSLHKTGQEAMEVVKDVMALKLLEKVLDTIQEVIK